MHNYEYLMVAHVNYQVIIVGDRTYDQGDGPHVAEIANELGQQGWEMVTAQYSHTESGYVGDIWFKRPL